MPPTRILTRVASSIELENPPSKNHQNCIRAGLVGSTREVLYSVRHPSQQASWCVNNARKVLLPVMPTRNAMCPGRACGFTLLEMLVVISILAALAFVAASTTPAVYDASKQRLVQPEIRHIAAAVMQFKQDTGYYPGEGPFALLSDMGGGSYDCSDDAATSPGAVDNTTIVSYGPDVTISIGWLQSPANVYQLLVQPLFCGNHPLAELDTWDASRSRGWHGPYLRDTAEGLVAVGNDTNPGNGYATGDPVLGGLINDVPAIADPFVQRPIGAYLAWKASVGAPERETWGRPYLLFLNDYSGAVVTRLEHPRIVSMGPDGDYAGCDDAAATGLCADVADDPCRASIGGTVTDDIILCLQ